MMITRTLSRFSYLQKFRVYKWIPSDDNLLKTNRINYVFIYFIFHLSIPHKLSELLNSLCKTIKISIETRDFAIFQFIDCALKDA